MEKNYYLIPTYSYYTYLNDIRLDRMMDIAYPELSLFEKRKEDAYNFNFDFDEYYKVSKQVDCLYRCLDIPEYLIVVEENGSFHELLTNGLVLTSNLSDFETHEVDYSLVSEYYNKSNYNERFSNYYSNYLLYNMNRTAKLLKQNNIVK